VHLRRHQVLASWRLFTLEIPDAELLGLADSALPADWRANPPPQSTARLGDGWVASASSLALSVPSTIVPRERNLLIDPAHPAFAALARGATGEPFGYDPRLAGQLG
jgi:RES domain-containing protein